jgi:hypothetical protein
MINAIAGVGMIAVGTLGSPGIGYFLDKTFDRVITEKDPSLRSEVLVERSSIFGTSKSLDAARVDKLDQTQQDQIKSYVIRSQQETLFSIALLPTIMFFCYLILIAYFRAKGGYQAQVLTGHAAQDQEFTRGTIGPGEG